MAQILLLHLPHIKADTVRRTSGLAVSGVRLLAQRESPTRHQESTAALGAEVSTQFWDSWLGEKQAILHTTSPCKRSCMEHVRKHLTRNQTAQVRQEMATETAWLLWDYTLHSYTNSDYRERVRPGRQNYMHTTSDTLHADYLRLATHTHTHTHTHSTASFPGRPGWVGTKKVKPVRI